MPDLFEPDDSVLEVSQEKEKPYKSEPDPFENFTMDETYGDPKCLTCKGRGRLSVTPPKGYRGPPSLRLCRCVLIRDILRNVERGMSGLSKARRVSKSPLTEHLKHDLLIHAEEDWFRAHMRFVALRQSPMWDFRVVSDADLMQAWLATAASKGMEILDSDVRQSMDRMSLRYMTLTDIAASAALLVIRLGVKAAANKEMPNVLLETIRTRDHEGLPTWIWESPSAPLQVGHLCWSQEIAEEIDEWTSITGMDAHLAVPVAPKEVPLAQRPPTPRDIILGPPKKITPDPVPIEEEEEGEEENPLMSFMTGSLPPKKKKYKKGGFGGR